MPKAPLRRDRGKPYFKSCLQRGRTAPLPDPQSTPSSTSDRRWPASPYLLAHPDHQSKISRTTCPCEEAMHHKQRKHATQERTTSIYEKQNQKKTKKSPLFSMWETPGLRLLREPKVHSRDPLDQARRAARSHCKVHESKKKHMKQSLRRRSCCTPLCMYQTLLYLDLLLVVFVIYV